MHLNNIWFKCEKDWLEKDTISVSTKYDFLSHSTNPQPPKIQHCQRTKISKTVLSVSSVFHAKFTISVLKNTKVFHPNGNWTQTASVGVLNWVPKVYATTDSEQKFQKTGIENWHLYSILHSYPQNYVQPLIVSVLKSN